MSYARSLRRAMKPHLQPDGKKIVEGFYLTKTKKGYFAGDRFINPTKGWRYPSIRAGHTAAITAEICTGLRPWSSHAFKDMLISEGIING